ncbi:hypothetical protein ABTC40_19055, partial [Acinetobacter baumannii]
VQSLAVSSGAPQTRKDKIAGANVEFMEILSACLYEQGEEIGGRQAVIEGDARACYRERKSGSRDSSNVAKVWEKQIQHAEDAGAAERFVWMG